MSNLARGLPVAGALLLALSTAAPALAAPTAPFTSYAAKFVCGPQKADADVVAGMYATDINIHNPQAKLTVRFFKKAVIVGMTNATIKYIADSLGPDAVEQVMCSDILKLLGGDLTAANHVEGYVVLEVPPVAADPAPYFPVLDVVGKYTARPSNGEVSSLSVERVPGNMITQ